MAAGRWWSRLRRLTLNKMAADLQRGETLHNNLMADILHELRTPLTDLNALAAECVQALEPLAAEKGVTLADRMGELPVVNADPIRIRHVLFNPLANALRHTPADGAITMIGTSRPATTCPPNARPMRSSSCAPPAWRRGCCRR